MKKLLLVSSLMLLGLFFSCNPKTGNKGKEETISNSEKVINHGGPNQAQMDSIKAAKTKKKQ